MRYLSKLAILAAAVLLIPDHSFGRGFGGGGGRGGGGGGGMRMGGGGGGGGMRAGGGGGGRPNFAGGGGGRSPTMSRPGGGSSRPAGGGANRANFAGGGGNRGGGSGIGNRPNIGGGNVSRGGAGERAGIGNRGGEGIANRGGVGIGNRGGEGIGNRGGEGIGSRGGAGIGNRGGEGIGNRGGNTGIGNRGGNNVIGNRGGNTNIANRGRIGNNSNFGNRTNIGSNNINIASNRSYFNNWQHGSWNGNWNRPGGGGYANGWAHGYAHGYMHGGWGGYWHGGWGGFGYWGRPWYAAPIAWGLGAWAIGSAIYNSGYSGYDNSYCDSGSSAGPSYYDYSQPIPVSNQQPADPTGAATADASGADPTPLPPEVQDGTSHMDLARDAFKREDYAAASQEIDLAIKALPKDAALHEFRALIFFATKDYKSAASALYAVLSAGPGWDWTTLSGMYADTTTYTNQLRVLEEFTTANTNSPDAHFVLGYHYMTCSHADSAAGQFKEVVRLLPSDPLAPQLLRLVTPDTQVGKGGQPTPQPPDAESAEDKPEPPADIDASKVVGKWTARRPDGSSFSLNLTADSKFKWGYEKSGKKQEFDGKYSVDGAILVLEQADGSQMPGLVTLGKDGFNFKLYGGPPDDPGLDFKK